MFTNLGDSRDYFSKKAGVYMKCIRRQKKFNKWYMGILLVLCLFCMGNTAKAQTKLTLDYEMEGSERILLKWESDSENSVYQLERAKDVAGPFSVLTTISGRDGLITSYDNNVTLGKTYYYKVKKLQDEKITEESAVQMVKITLEKPVNIKTKRLKGPKVKISWNKTDKATGYKVYRSTNTKKKFKKIGTVKKNEFTDVSVGSGKVYYYKVRAIKKNKKSVTSSPSDVAAVYMKPAVPAVTGSYNKKKIKITWGKIEGADSYDIYKKNSKGQYKKIGTTKKLYYADGKVKKGKSYFYKVEAVYCKDGKTIKSKMSKKCEVLAEAIDPNKKMVALTFDDGPGRYTKDIVNCLKKNDAKATFFVIGSQVDSYKSSVKAASEIGCEIGNHTYTHPDLTRLSEEEIKSQISNTDKKVKNATGKTPTLVRTPYGSVNSKVEQAVGKPIILWSIDTRDWQTRNKSKTVNAVMGNVKDGDIILMHDIYKPTKEAACTLIVQLKRKGYQLVTVSELAKYRGYTLTRGKVYHSLRK